MEDLRVYRKGNSKQTQLLILLCPLPSEFSNCLQGEETGIALLFLASSSAFLFLMPAAVMGIYLPLHLR